MRPRQLGGFYEEEKGTRRLYIKAQAHTDEPFLLLHDYQEPVSEKEKARLKKLKLTVGLFRAQPESYNRSPISRNPSPRSPNRKKFHKIPINPLYPPIFPANGSNPPVSGKACHSPKPRPRLLVTAHRSQATVYRPCLAPCLAICYRKR